MAVIEVLSLLVVLLALSHSVDVFTINKDEYLSLRNDILHKEYEMRTGGKIRLSDAECRVNNILMKLKAKELDIARTNITNFPPAVHFFRAKALIDKSEVFNIIRVMPKGKCTQCTLCNVLLPFLRASARHIAVPVLRPYHSPDALNPDKAMELVYVGVVSPSGFFIIGWCVCIL